MGLGSGQQYFGKSNEIVLILMPDYFGFLQIKGQDIFWEWERKKKKTIPAPEDQRVDPLAILYMVNWTVCKDIENVAC